MTGKGNASATAKKVTTASKKAQTKAKQPAVVKTKAGASKVSSLRTIFEGAGFQHIPSDALHFQMSGRTGEIDHIFAFENVILICEETAATTGVSGHFTNKVFFHKLISEDFESFCNVYKPLNSHFSAYLDKNGYEPQELEVRHLYLSEAVDCEPGVSATPDPFVIVTRAHMRYFTSLVKTIGRTSRFELFKYLKIQLSMIGDARISGQGVSSESFSGFALPSGHTHYPKGFAVVSFYANPSALLTRAYVLRRDGWDSPDVSYQRFVKSSKLEEMRSYLAQNGKVFINNLIVTLPSTVILKNKETDALIDLETFNARADVVITLPHELGTIGVVDGQHRVLSYYEGVGSVDQKIESLRKRQNLLVTGIVFPKSYSSEDRVKFEAELFLSINNTQTGVKADLRQELETIINPHTPAALAKAVVNALANKGPLSGFVQTSMYDSPEKVKSASLVTYVVLPLIKPDPGNPFFALWDPSKSLSLSDAVNRKSYVEFCIHNINKVLAGARDNLHGQWRPVTKTGTGILSPTSIGGLVLCLRDLLSVDSGACAYDFSERFKGLDAFDFSKYKSSVWAKLAADIVQQFFPSVVTASPLDATPVAEDARSS